MFLGAHIFFFRYPRGRVFVQNIPVNHIGILTEIAMVNENSLCFILYLRPKSPGGLYTLSTKISYMSFVLLIISYIYGLLILFPDKRPKQSRAFMHILMQWSTVQHPCRLKISSGIVLTNKHIGNITTGNPVLCYQRCHEAVTSKGEYLPIKY